MPSTNVDLTRYVEFSRHIPPSSRLVDDQRSADASSAAAVSATLGRVKRWAMLNRWAMRPSRVLIRRSAVELLTNTTSYSLPPATPPSSGPNQ